MRRNKTFVTATAGLLACAATAATAHAQPLTGAAAHTRGAERGPAGTPVVVVRGLNNPRELSLPHGSRLLIAEAGRGGSRVVKTPQGKEYVGRTGSISAVGHPYLQRNRKPHRIVTGLLSGAESPDGSFAVGSDGVSERRLGGPIYIQMTYAPPDALPQPAGSEQDGMLLRAAAYGHRLRPVADISKVEKNRDPDGHGFDSDPYAVLALPTGQLVADAAGNDVLYVNQNAGVIRVWHVFRNVLSGPCAKQHDPTPQFPGCNFVPTSLARDAAGHIYVGGLSGLVPGQAQVVELTGNGRKVLHRWRGFSAVTGVAVAHDGTLYVSQLMAKEANPPAKRVTGVLTRIAPDGTRTDTDVPFPAGVVVGKGKLDGQGRHVVFVAAWSVAPHTGAGGPGTSGQVWRMRF